MSWMTRRVRARLERLLGRAPLPLGRQSGSLDTYVLDMYKDDAEIEFDPNKARSNLRKHRVGFADAEQALRDDHAVTIADPDAEGEPRFVTLGRDALGRVLVVVHAPRGSRVRLISARRASPGEVEQYHAN